MILMDHVQLPCGHVKHGVACHLTQNPARIPCDVKISKRVPGCEHDVVLKCSVDVSKKDFKCPTLCNTPLSCGHPCPGTCAQCNTKDMYDQPVVKHAACRKTCGRKHGTCNHDCSRRCHDGTDCGLCQAPCEVSDAYQFCDTSLISFRYVANTPSVHRGVTSPVLRVLSLAHGPASIKAIAKCLARPRVAAYHATSDAPSFFRAVISVQASAVKHVQSSIVKSVA